MRQIAKLRNVAADGVLSNYFLAISQGLHFNDGQLMVVYHKFDLVKMGSLGIIQTKEKYNDLDMFACNIFNNKYVVMLESDVKYFPMNAIAGPFTEYFKTVHSTYLSRCGAQFIEMRDNQDSWTHAYLATTTYDLNLIHIKESVWRTGQGIKAKLNRNQRRNTPKAYNVLKLQRLQEQCSKEA